MCVKTVLIEKMIEQEGGKEVVISNAWQSRDFPNLYGKNSRDLGNS